VAIFESQGTDDYLLTLNVGVSIALITTWGLAGVAIGTLTAIVYRLVYFAVYLKKSMLKLNIKKYLPLMTTSAFVLGCNVCIYIFWPVSVHSILSFLVSGMVIFICECTAVFVANVILFKIVPKKVWKSWEMSL
jgi:Na+-driven multidrug efflux pump